MLGPAKPDAFGAESARDRCIVRRVGVSPHTEFAKLIDPLHQCLEMPADLRLDQRHLADNHATGRSVERDPVAFFDGQSSGSELLVSVIDYDVAASGNAAFAHTASHHRGMGGHSSA